MSVTPKVLVVASSFSHIRNFHLPYLQGFHDAGWEVHLACGGDRTEIPYADKITIVPFQKRLTALTNWKAALLIRREVKKNKYNLVIAHTSLAAFFARMALKKMQQKPHCINVVHGYLFDDACSCPRHTLYKLAEKFVADVTDEILTMNQYDLAWARNRFPHTKVGYIPGMGVDEKRIARVGSYDFKFPEGSITLIFPAEFSPRKNQAMLIRAVSRLPEPVRLVLPGSGALLEECKSLAKELGVAERVLFPGYITDVLPMLKGADIAISSSRYEGLPFNLMEAMFCGLPIVASQVKGNCDLVEAGVNGLLFDYDDVDGFVQAISQLLGSKELRQGMGQASTLAATRYGLDAVYPQVMKAYLGDTAAASAD